MLGKLTPLCVTVIFALTGCASVTDKIPTVKIERKKPRVIKTVQSHTQQASTLNASHTTSHVEQAEAAMVCENDNMRSRAQDGNSKNDNARVLILEEGGRASNVIADVEVNCRDYFQRASTRRITPSYPATTRIVSAPQPISQVNYVTTQSVPLSPAQHVPAQRPQTQRIVQTPVTRQPSVIKASSNVQAADGYYYSIKKGDTLYRIARENCSSVNDISVLNGISDPTKIEVHQIIRLPAQKCNARN